MGQFSNQLRQAVELAKGKLDETVSSTVVLIAQQLVQRSPVGNPDLWKANSKASARRETYNTTVDAYNAETGSKVRRKGVKGLRKSFPNVAGKGYTGGRFRANWQVGIGLMDTTTTEDTDAGGGKTLQRLSGEARRARAGTVVVISNILVNRRAILGLCLAPTLGPGKRTELPILAAEWHKENVRQGVYGPRGFYCHPDTRLFGARRNGAQGVARAGRPRHFAGFGVGPYFSLQRAEGLRVHGRGPYVRYRGLLRPEVTKHQPPHRHFKDCYRILRRRCFADSNFRVDVRFLQIDLGYNFTN